MPGTPAARRATFLGEAMLINGKATEALKIEISAAELDPGHLSWVTWLTRFRKAAQLQRQE
jgi:hypothetical protein